MEQNGKMEWEMVGYEDGEMMSSSGEVFSSIYDVGDERMIKWRSSLGAVDVILRLGKNLVIAGVVMSSIPVVVPPLIVMSALGCALSLPFGLIFATYATTDTLMSKLFMPPPPPPVADDDYLLGAIIALHEYDERANKEKNVTAAVEMTTIEEEKEQHPVIINNDYEEKIIGHHPPNYGVATQIIMNAKDDESPAAQPPLDVKQGDHLSQDPNAQLLEQTAVLKPNSNSKETETKRRRGKQIKALKLRSKRKVSVQADDDQKHKEKSAGDEQRLIQKKTSTLATQGELCPPEEQSPQVVQDISADTSSARFSISNKEQVSEKTTIMLGNENNDTKRVSSKNNILLNDHVGNIDSLLKKEHKANDTKDKDIVIHDACQEMTDKSKFILARKIAMDVPSNDGDVNQKFEHCSVTIYSDPHGNDFQFETITGDGELNHDLSDLKEEKDASAGDSGANPNEEGLLGDEKMWKKIDAIRAIVGYKAPNLDSCVEEVKALYLFTGIEPPSGSADLHNKLSFLMSVIGLK